MEVRSPVIKAFVYPVVELEHSLIRVRFIKGRNMTQLAIQKCPCIKSNE
jgi:hypothetical protein